MGPTQELANFVVTSRYADLPSSVVHEAKRSLLNWLGVAIGAARHPTIDIAMRYVAKVSGKEQASILGRTERTDILHASFVNGTSSHVFDFDDTHLDTIIHPSGPVAPPLLALAEERGMSGRDLVHAFVLGVEVECRIGNAVYPAHYDVGWHITATTGVFGSAAASGKALSLDVERMAQALGLAATQSSGLREMFGTMSKPFHVGRAAQSGLFAALLAGEGFTSSLQVIEAKRGFANVLSTERDYRRISDGLGETFEIAKNTYKPFACGIVIHPTIDGCIQLRDRHGLNAGDIASVELQVHPLVLELTGKTELRRGLEGKFSVYHSAAVALIDGAAGEAQYSDERVKDPEVVALRGKVKPTPTSGIDEAEAVVRVTTTAGETHEVHVEHALGSLERPMSDRDLEEKFTALVEPILSPEKAQALIDLMWDLENVKHVTDIVNEAVAAVTV